MHGAVVAQYRKARGKTYGPYWVRVWREGGRVRKAYVPPRELEAVRAACEANRRDRARIARTRAGIRRAMSDFAFYGRLLRRMDREGGAFVATEAETERVLRGSSGVER